MADDFELSPDDRTTFETIAFELSGDIISPTADFLNPTEDEIRRNEGEILARSWGVQLGDLPSDTKVSFEFNPTSSGAYKFINLNLLSWPGEDGIRKGQSILAYVDAPVIPVINQSRFIVIHGASVPPELPERRYLGQIRENGEVAVTPLRPMVASQIIDDMRHDLWHDAESREQHIAERNITPIFLPRVMTVTYLDPVTKKASQYPWRHPRALES